MKKQNKLMDFLNSRGFYTALFTCLFAVLAIAAFVSIRNIDQITKLTTYGEKDVSMTDELRPAGLQSEKPLSEMTQSEISRAKTNTGTDSTESKSTAPTPNSAPKTPAPSAQEITEEYIREYRNERQAQVQSEQEQEQAKEEAPAAPKKEEPKQETTAEPAKQESKSEKKTEPQASATSQDMDWPLDGAIVMSYSMDHTIYDKTLEQYRTNPTVSISSEVGTQVKAAADGVVKSITIDPRTGYTLVIDHGNGWETVYGQLQETVLAKEGDGVKKGQAVGGVGTPTKYGILLGPHLVFGVNKDESPQNPSVVLAE